MSNLYANDAKLLHLARSFPALKSAPLPDHRFDEYSLNDLDRWGWLQRVDPGLMPDAGFARASAVEFVLAVWDNSAHWAVGPFDLMRAFRHWSEGDRTAFGAWCAEPWQR